MEKINAQITQAKSFTAILMQSNDGMVQMTARMINGALDAIKDEMKNAQDCSKCEFQQHFKTEAVRLIEIKHISQSSEENLAPPHTPDTKKVSKMRCSPFSYGAYFEESEFYSRKQIAEMMSCSEAQFSNVYHRYCETIPHDKIQGKRTMLWSGKSCRKIVEIIKRVYGYKEPPDTMAVIREDLPQSPSEDNYLYEYCQEKRKKQAAENPPQEDPEWPDAMPDSLKDDGEEIE